MRRVMLAALALLALLPAAAFAQTGERCFPETGQCIGGRIRLYWEANGGLAVFGYPITAVAAETVEGVPLQVQWFERDRLEIQPNDVITAGRLGAQRLEQLGRPFTPGPGGVAPAGCTMFPETGYAACGDILAYWRANGGLARFGYPLTGEVQETLEGQVYTVQWFERRRIERHPELPGSPLLLGLLGREVSAAATAPPPQPTAPPAPAPTAVPPPPIQPTEVLDQYRREMPQGLWQVNKNGIQLSATGFQYQDRIGQYQEAGDGFKYVVFALEVANTGYDAEYGDDNFFANSASFDLIDLDGQTHSVDSALYALDGYFRGGTFYQGTKASGQMVFRIAENSAPAIIIFDGPERVDLDLRVAPIQ